MRCLLGDADEEAGEVEKAGACQDTGGQREGVHGRCHSRCLLWLGVDGPGVRLAGRVLRFEETYGSGGACAWWIMLASISEQPWPAASWRRSRRT